MRVIDTKRAPVRTKDFFSIEWVKYSGITNEMVPTVKKRGWERKQILCRNVFHTFFQIVINDVIDNDVCFYAPVRPHFKVYIKVKNETEMKRIYNNPGIYGDVDFIKTNGKIYSVRFTLPYVRERRNREIRINYKDYKRIVKKANEGFIWSAVKETRISHYIESITEKFPTLDEKLIRKIIRKGCKMLVENVIYRKPIKMSNPQIKFNAYIYHPNWKLLKAMAANG